jgi:ribokinase
MRAVVVGSTNVDHVLTVPALPRPGETALATASRREAGGKGANQAVALARLGADVLLVSAVGDDEPGRWSLDQLTADGVDVSGVTLTPGTATGTAFVLVDAQAENLIVVDPGANALVVATTALVADVLLLSLEIPMTTVVDAASRCAAPVVLNAAPAQPLPPELLAQVDVLVLNEHEAEAIGTAQALLAAGPATVIVTRGDQGCSVFDADGDRSWPAVPCDVVDTTGAGDSFSAAVALGVGSGWPIERTIALALAVAARAVSAPGARGAVLSDLQPD